MAPRPNCFATGLGLFCRPRAAAPATQGQPDEPVIAGRGILGRLLIPASAPFVPNLDPTQVFGCGCPFVDAVGGGEEEEGEESDGSP